jgi:hypothetical protein
VDQQQQRHRRIEEQIIRLEQQFKPLLNEHGNLCSDLAECVADALAAIRKEQ